MFLDFNWLKNFDEISLTNIIIFRSIEISLSYTIIPKIVTKRRFDAGIKFSSRKKFILFLYPYLYLRSVRQVEFSFCKPARASCFADRIKRNGKFSFFQKWFYRRLYIKVLAYFFHRPFSFLFFASTNVAWLL